ncbi:GntR family transcriptional regulator [Petroclostridium sp. X23]|uniref:GntR family transcriptional regulator n=1 Tax=Petroclostridium sp. X23 TaxID=3045146 RepID=UPI0024ACD374|nr:GntR family transcriptional regulator [Petroclostridium sp. X23]WHH57305.1 GntR family transcriptional regulator [Petroclostridium sp. X23]
MAGKLSKINLNDYKPLREVIFDSLREAIIMGELKPGERLMEIQLAEKMGVSRTPVREAIRKLELEGLVVMIPRKGAHVAELSVKDIKDVLEVRSSLDGLASALAAKRINKDELRELGNIVDQFAQYLEKNNVQGLIKKDVEFHELIYKASRNEKLGQIATNLKEQIHRFRVVYLKDYSSPKELMREHNEIYHAIESGDEKLAEELALIHIRHQEKAMISSLKTEE